MQLVVLPFNAAPGARPELGRQIANFLADLSRNVTGKEINAVAFTAQIEQHGIPRMQQVNADEKLNDPELLLQFLGQSDTQSIVDGLLEESGEGVARAGRITVRWTERDQVESGETRVFDYDADGLQTALRDAVSYVLSKLGSALPPNGESDLALFGTSQPAALVNALIGYDTAQFIDKSRGMVEEGWSPEPGLEALTDAVEAEPEWANAHEGVLKLATLCMQFGVGNAKLVEKYLLRFSELRPQDFRVWYSLGELYALAGETMRATDAYEKALKLQPDTPAILTRLAQVQVVAGMPVNAERNLRRAVALEEGEKPSLDLLSAVLVQTGRAHEVPPLFQAEIEANPQNPDLRVKLAGAYMGAGREEDALRTFDRALEELEDPIIAKRYYAPVLAQRKDLDRAMDLYEDCLDVAPTDVPLLLEYAQTLQAAGRSFEVPRVLRDVLSANPDPNTRAEAQAWLLELDEPRRTQAVADAQDKLNAGDAQGAIASLRPLKNWLADYWKLWIVLAAALNRVGDHVEAEKAARTLLEMFPGCEPGYGELSGALIGLGRNEEAYALLQVALRNMPQSLTIALNLALAAKHAGREDESRALVRQIREAVQGNEQIEQAIQQIEQAQPLQTLDS